jgi:RNA polymerase sigma-70 factor (ECF subfamily)
VSLYLEELPADEIAAVLGISEGNVRVKLHRIKHHLRETWEKESYEPR